MENDAALWSRFLAGDEKAFEALVTAYRPGLIRFIEGFVHDPFQAEDLAADCFAHMLAFPKKYDGRVSVRTWLFVLGRSRALDALRRGRRFRFVSPEDVEGELTDPDSPEDAVAADEMRDAVQRAVAALPEAERTAVTLVYFEGFSYKDAASVLGKTVKQTDNLLVSAKRKLKKSLSEEGRSLL